MLVSEAQCWCMAGVMGSLPTSLKAIYDFEAKKTLDAFKYT